MNDEFDNGTNVIDAPGCDVAGCGIILFVAAMAVALMWFSRLLMKLIGPLSIVVAIVIPALGDEDLVRPHDLHVLEIPLQPAASPLPVQSVSWEIIEPVGHNFREFPTPTAAMIAFVTASPGERVVVKALVINWESREIAKKTWVVRSFPNKPDDPDQPDEPDQPDPPPNVPPDEFSNIGQRVAQVVAKISQPHREKRLGLAEIYTRAADKLKSGGTRAEANAILAERGSLVTTPADVAAWEPFASLIRADFSSRQWSNAIHLANWYAAVAAGLRGGQ